MLLELKKPVLIVLAVLQFLAPLVHAHTGASHQHGGIHMPGLEPLLHIQHAPVLEKVNSAWSSEGLLVMVDAGIKNSQDSLSQSVSAHSHLAIAGFLPDERVKSRPQNFSPHPITLPFSSTSLPPNAPRAPPRHQIV